MKKVSKEYAYQILETMSELFPEARSELSNWNTPFQFLVSIILSAQTTDARVNIVNKGLFAKFPTPDELSNASISEVEPLIKSVNYYKTKSRNIIETSRILVERFNSIVPADLASLMSLPGVGYKTANVFLNDMYKANRGIGADTHVIRVSNRLRLSSSQDADKVAADLERIYDRKDWYRINSLFVLYGRYICKARVKPEDSKCVFKEYCTHCGLIP